MSQTTNWPNFYDNVPSYRGFFVGTYQSPNVSADIADIKAILARHELAIKCLLHNNPTAALEALRGGTKSTINGST